jgi:hypothetical protein
MTAMTAMTGRANKNEVGYYQQSFVQTRSNRLARVTARSSRWRFASLFAFVPFLYLHNPINDATELF